ncbi:cyclin, partial [Aureobasidium melanogenum]
MWQMGRCHLSSIQCDFRHADPSMTAQPVLAEAFTPQPRSSYARWQFGNHAVHRDRQPLQEIVLPASLTSIHEYEQDGQSAHEDAGQSTWGSPRSSPQRWSRANSAEGRQTSTSRESTPIGVGYQNDTSNAWRAMTPTDAAAGPEQNITVWEDQEEGSAGSASMSISRSDSDSDSEDEISRLARIEEEVSDEEEEKDDKENELPVVMPRRLVNERENQRRRSRFERDFERTDFTRARPSPSPSRPHIFTSTNSPLRNMSHSREMSQNGAANNDNGVVGPHPSFIQVANPYIFQQQLQNSLNALGATEHKEDSIRLQGVHYIDSVRKALQLPVRTFNTAVVYYHKFRLVHADSEYMWADAAAAALFTACKIEDTLKKSREVLCAAWNLKLPSSEHLSPDDPVFEQPSKTVVGIERLMLESAGFDFRTRHPQETVIKIVRDSGWPKETLGRTAYNMSIDIYRTFAPLKQTAQTMAIACIELTARLLNLTTDFNMDAIVGPEGISLEKWSTTRGEIMETLLDLLDLFTHHRHATIVGNQFSIDNYIAVRITLNKEATALNLPRYTETIDAPKSGLNGAANGASKHSPVSPALPGATNQSPNSPPAMGPTSATGARSRVGERGKDGTVRFMLSAERARGEKEAVAKYFAADEYETYEEEVDVPLGQ